VHQACTIFCLTKAKVLLPPLTHSSPSPTEVFPCLKEVENLQQLLVVLHQKTEEENQGAQEVPPTATAGV